MRYSGDPYQKDKENWSFFAGFLETAQKWMRSIIQPLLSDIEEKREKIARKISAKIVTFIGFVFLSYGLAIFVSDFLGVSRWVGFVFLGIILLVIGKIKDTTNNH